MKNLYTWVAAFLFVALAISVMACTSASSAGTVTVVDRPDIHAVNTNYMGYRAPLRPLNFIKLPVGNIRPEGWVRKFLELQRDGLTGHLGEISAWLEKDDNAWLTTGGDHGWEEVPYWLKGYSSLAYILNDPKMIEETKYWIEGVFASRQPDGYFGPVNERNGKRELWAQMIMLWCLQSYYEYSQDQRVIDLMTNYFRWQMTVPDDRLLEDFWENSRGGDNIISIYWLYSHTGDAFLLELAEKIHRNSAMLNASYNVHRLIRRTFGQVPGGMFGADENARLGYIDPRQGVETCGLVEQMASDEIMLRITGDPLWAEHCEEVAFNSYPVAVMPDFKALRYITCPNHVVSDSKNHHPGIDNRGPFLSMNPFSSRCCQHNHAQGWPYFAEHLVLATPDNGVATALYAACKAVVKVADGKEITLHEETNYPFEEDIRFSVSTEGKVVFPFYFRIPSWTQKAKVCVNGEEVDAVPVAGKYLCIHREWSDGDCVELTFPMSLSMRTWQVNKNSVSVDYGPLTLSLKIAEKYVEKDSRETAIGDSKWQKDADPQKWPTTEIYSGSAWNYSLVLDKTEPLKHFEVIRKSWPADDYPFTVANVPLEVKAVGRLVPEWEIDETGLCGVLPEEDAARGDKEEITLIPMGAARLRISAFPNTRE